MIDGPPGTLYSLYNNNNNGYGMLLLEPCIFMLYKLRSYVC